MVKRTRERLPPKRSPEVWAREFVEALERQTGTAFAPAEVLRIAARDKRLRERVPASVVTIALGSAKAAGLSIAEWLHLAGKHSGFLVRQPKDVQRGLKELKQSLGIGEDGALRLVKKQPILLCYAPRGIARRVAALSKAAALSPRDGRSCAKRCPSLLTVKPATLSAHARAQRIALGLTLADYGKVVMREPLLLLRSPDTIERVIKGMVRLWGLSRKEALGLCLKSPKLAVVGLVDTMDDKLVKLAHGLRSEKRQLVKAAQSFPPLTYLKPETLIAAFETGARVLGVSKRTLADAVLRSPSLLARRTEGWAWRMRLVIRISRALGNELTPAEALQKFPAAMTYGKGRLLQRYVMARLGLWRMNWMALLSLSDRKARVLLESYFERQAGRAGLRKALQRRGLL